MLFFVVSVPFKLGAKLQNILALCKLFRNYFQLIFKVVSTTVRNRPILQLQPNALPNALSELFVQLRRAMFMYGCW